MLVLTCLSSSIADSTSLLCDDIFLPGGCEDLIGYTSTLTSSSTASSSSDSSPWFQLVYGLVLHRVDSESGGANDSVPSSRYLYRHAPCQMAGPHLRGRRGAKAVADWGGDASKQSGAGAWGSGAPLE